MLRTMLKSEIRRATVTRADPDHAGSVIVDPVLMDAADLLAGEQVTVVDVASGARLATHVVAGERGSGELGVNGAAVRPGDTVVLVSYGLMDPAEAAAFAPRVVFVDERNRIADPGRPAAAPVSEVPAETADAAMLDALLQSES